MKPLSYIVAGMMLTTMIQGVSTILNARTGHKNTEALMELSKQVEILKANYPPGKIAALTEELQQVEQLIPRPLSTTVDDCKLPGCMVVRCAVAYQNPAAQKPAPRPAHRMLGVPFP